MIEIFDPNIIPLDKKESLKLSSQLLKQKETIFHIPLLDGPIQMPGKWLIVNFFIWRPLVKRGMPIEKKHVMMEGVYTCKRRAAIQTHIYNDVVAAALLKYGRMPPEIDRVILEDFCDTVDDLHTMIITQLGEYHLSMSAFELCDLLLEPSIQPLLDIDVSKELQIGVSATREKIQESSKIIMKRLADRSIPNNILVPYLELGHLSNHQIPSVVSTIGFRSEAADQVIRYPIMTSYMNGLRNITDYAVESLMAKKTIYYNASAMPDTQYNNRKQQILSSDIRRLYPGDCGSTVTIPFYIHRDNVQNVYDKNIVITEQTSLNHKTQKLICLDPSNVHEYIGTTVNFRSPFTCRYRDGICHACGGRLTAYMPQHVSVGISSTVELMGRVAQLVLSAKHYSDTKAVMYMIPTQMQDYLLIRQDDIYIHPSLDTSRVQIGVHYKDIVHIKELLGSEDADTDMSLITEQQFSTIRNLVFVDEITGTPITPETYMTVDKTSPYFSEEFLEFIVKNPKNVSLTDDMVWISLKNFDFHNYPLFRFVMQSNSMKKFVEDLTRFTTSYIRNYTSIPEALKDFSELVFSKIGDVNILHLEVVLRSYLITSEDDYHIPVIENVENVMFGTLMSIIPRRSLGGLFAFERLISYMTTKPELYLLPHQQGDFDPFFMDC